MTVAHRGKHRIYLRTKYNSILLHLTIYMIYNSVGQWLWSMGGDCLGESEEMSADTSSVYV